MNTKHPFVLGYPRLVTKEELESMFNEATDMNARLRNLPRKELRKVFYRIISKQKKQGKLVVI